MTFAYDARTCIIARARPSRAFVCAAVLSFAAALLLASHAAQAGELDEVIAFDIAPMTLDQALLEFGTEERLQIMFASNSSTERYWRSGLKGRFTGKEALAEILKGTRLTYIERGNTLEVLPQASIDPSTAALARKLLNVQLGGDPETSNDRASKTRDYSPGTRHSQNGPPPPILGEVVVTAQKYSQRTFDVPISLDVITGEDLQDQGITSLSNLVYDVPGLYMNNTGTTHAVYIRGVADLYGSGALVGQYIDEADITAAGTTGDSGLATGDSGLYDLNRVEVLKGPQGTLYGDSSIGGVIRYITNKPVLDHFQMSTDAAAEFTEDGAPGQRIEAMLNTPLVGGELGLRLAGLFEHDGGWIDEPAANLKNINGSNLVDVRAETLWQPADQFTASAMELIHRHTYGIDSGEDANGNVTPLFGTTLTPNAADNSNVSNVTLTYDFPGARLLNSSTYVKDTQEIYDQFNSEVFGPITEWLLDQHDAVSTTDLSDELRLVHSGAGPWQWTVGGFYKHYSYVNAQAEYIGLAGSTLSSAYYLPAALDFGNGSSSSSASFADTSYRFFERLTVGAGVRYFRDRETERTPTPYPYGAPTFSSTDPRFYLQYRVSPRVNAYVSASKGFRTGGLDGVINGSFVPPYQPETLWNYDLGTKIRLPRQGLQTNVDVFYMEYSNFITARYFPPLGVSADANAGDAKIEGVDADVMWQPAAQWRVTLNSEILDTEFLTATAVSGYAVGERLPFAPKYSLTASVQRNFHWNDKPADVEVYYDEMSRVQLRATGFSLGQSDVMRFLSARASIEWSDNLRLGLFAHNLLNDRGLESPSGPIFGLSARPRPRTFGVEFDTKFL